MHLGSGLLARHGAENEDWVKRPRIQTWMRMPNLWLDEMLKVLNSESARAEDAAISRRCRHVSAVLARMKLDARNGLSAFTHWRRHCFAFSESMPKPTGATGRGFSSWVLNRNENGEGMDAKGSGWTMRRKEQR